MVSDEDSGYESEKPTTGGAQSNVNGATCRICMLEGSEENPLFHPCKCKGSIKYIHQPCLIEWLESKNVDIKKPGANTVCSICNHPIEFQTLYEKDMPDRIPLSLLLKHSVLGAAEEVNYYFKFTLIGIIFLIGIPLSWNVWGKLYTAAVDDFSFPSDNKWYINIIFGFEKSIPEHPSTSDIIYQLLNNYRFSVIQMAVILVVHAIAYLQYDMVVREPIFNKMIIHKIGPKWTKQDLAIQTLRDFPNIDPRDLNRLINTLDRHNQEESNDENSSSDEDEEQQQPQQQQQQLHQNEAAVDSDVASFDSE